MSSASPSPPYDRVLERRRAVALARHFREAEGLSIAPRPSLAADRLEQRVGRAARPGAARAHVQTYIPYIRRGGVEHIVSVLASRGAEHHQILDSLRRGPQ